MYLLDLFLPHPSCHVFLWSKLYLMGVNFLLLPSCSTQPFREVTTTQPCLWVMRVEGALAFVDPVSSGLGPGTTVPLSWESVVGATPRHSPCAQGVHHTRWERRQLWIWQFSTKNQASRQGPRRQQIWRGTYMGSNEGRKWNLMQWTGFMKSDWERKRSGMKGKEDSRRGAWHGENSTNSRARLLGFKSLLNLPWSLWPWTVHLSLSVPQCPYL